MIRPAAEQALAAGVKDAVLGEGLCRIVIGESVARLDRRWEGTQ